MKNLRAYIYMYVGIQLLLPTVLVTAISWHLKNYYILGFYVIVLIVFSGYPCMPFKELCKKKKRYRYHAGFCLRKKMRKSNRWKTVFIHYARFTNAYYPC